LLGSGECPLEVALVISSCVWGFSCVGAVPLSRKKVDINQEKQHKERKVKEVGDTNNKEMILFTHGIQTE
jgi:hypothetical protein